MKALLIIKFPGQLDNATAVRVKDSVMRVIRGDTLPVLAFDGGATAEVLYLPDNFTEANCYTPEEAQAIIERIRAAGVVVGTL